jgi:hypothetical protein
MRRLATLALVIAICLVAASPASAKPLQPPLSPEARSAQSDAVGGDAAPITVAAGLAVLLVGAALHPRAGRRRAPAPA